VNPSQKCVNPPRNLWIHRGSVWIHRGICESTAEVCESTAEVCESTAGRCESAAETIIIIISSAKECRGHGVPLGLLDVLSRPFTNVAENILTLWLPIGRGQRIFSHSGFLLVVGREYSHTLASSWSWAGNILTLWLLIGRGQRIFSHSGFLLVVGREYSHTLASYWSWAENILTLWLPIGRGQRIFSHSGSLLVVGWARDVRSPLKSLFYPYFIRIISLSWYYIV
jgi:hypothetical protein